MALSVTYTNFDGELVYENRNGTPSFYVPDTLGSTAQLWSEAGVKTDEWTYWPYGEVRTRTGTTATPFNFVGTLGYYLDILGRMIYVRARILRQALARWQTVDPVWPRISAYGYCNNSPCHCTDQSGRDPCDDNFAACLAAGAVLLAACLAVVAIELAVDLSICASTVCAGAATDPELLPACLGCYAVAREASYKLTAACIVGGINYVGCCKAKKCCCDAKYSMKVKCCQEAWLMTC